MRASRSCARSASTRTARSATCSRSRRSRTRSAPSARTRSSSRRIPKAGRTGSSDGVVTGARERFAVPITHVVVDLDAEREDVRSEPLAEEPVLSSLAEAARNSTSASSVLFGSEAKVAGMTPLGGKPFSTYAFGFTIDSRMNGSSGMLRRRRVGLQLVEVGADLPVRSRRPRACGRRRSRCP